MKILLPVLLLTFFSTSSFAQKANDLTEAIIVADKGWGVVSLGAKRKTIEAALGEGQARSLDNESYSVSYPNKGVRVFYTKQKDEADTIFLYNSMEEYPNFVTPAVKTDKGISWRSSAEDVLKAYGKPKQDFGDSGGDNAWRRLEYDKTDFLFQSGELKRIGIHTELCTLCPEKRQDKLPTPQAPGRE